ncbi:hypothetical protein GH714_038427 [Hevea brasiliensis]|uniref:WRC domain-containing protein n=1 Tax=Hevea brasiliensis TaxID=3981 RepID=A0A6A6KEC8_HEVBR|nr:hypothetical protein GH714_038427 [Hevea brasiliensis]
MAKNEDTGSPGWRASLFLQTTEDVARAVAAAAAAATAPRSPRPSVVFSSKDDHGDSQFQKLQRHVSRVLKGFSSPPHEVKGGTYNPEVLTSQKRQWANFQLQYLDHRHLKEPSRLFESMVVVGLHPNCDLQALQRQYVTRRFEGSGRLQGSLGSQNQSRIEPILEPQVLFVYPPDKQLPLKYKDLVSFCFPGGLEVGYMLTGSCVPLLPLLTYSLKIDVSENSNCEFSILTEERLERLTKDVGVLDFEFIEGSIKEEILGDNLDGISPNCRDAEEMLDGTAQNFQSSSRDSAPGDDVDNGSHLEHQILEGHIDLSNNGNDENVVVPVDSEMEIAFDKGESGGRNLEDCETDVDDLSNKQAEERRLPNAVLPLLRYYQYESSESSSSFQGSPSEDRNFRSDVDDTETEEASFSGQEDSNDHMDILEWAKANKYGSLQIICEYYQLHCPSRGSTVRFHPLEHLHPLEYHKPDETVLHIAGSTIDLRSCSTSLEFAEAHSALSAEEEATVLSTWAIACLCGSLRLENILPDDMLDFLDAPVPYIVGVKNKTSEVQSKLTNAILVDANKNQVKSPTIPQLPKRKELFSSLSPYHAKLVGESYLARKRPVYECTDVQVESAKGFLAVLRSYLDSLCSNLRSHTITNVQSNNDKVSLLLKESFIDSFPNRDRPFMKHICGPLPLRYDDTHLMVQVGWSCFQMGLGRKIDPEPGRCRRTDGKKWRCSKEAYPDSKYCERHMHRGKNRSRKPVEVATQAATANPSITPTISSITKNHSTLLTPPSHSLSLMSSETHQHHLHYSHLNNQFLSSHTSSRPPGIGLSPQDNATPLLLDSGGSCSLTNADYRSAYGLKEEVDEHAFFSEHSGSMRSLSGSSLDNAWQFTPLTMSSSSTTSSSNQRSSSSLHNEYSYLQLHSLSDRDHDHDAPKQQKQYQQSYLLGTDMKGLLPAKIEREEEPQKIFHRFFDEWPPKNKDSWLNLDDKSPNSTSVSTTRLSISIPSSSHEFPIFNSRTHNDV